MPLVYSALALRQIDILGEAGSSVHTNYAFNQNIDCCELYCRPSCRPSCRSRGPPQKKTNIDTKMCTVIGVASALSRAFGAAATSNTLVMTR